MTGPNGIIAGAAGYVVWRAAEVVVDPYEFGNDWKGLLQRGGAALSGVGYGISALSAARIALGKTAPTTRDAAEADQQRLVAEVLEWPCGGWVIGAAGFVDSSD